MILICLQKKIYEKSKKKEKKKRKGRQMVFKSDAGAPEKPIIFLVAYGHNLP